MAVRASLLLLLLGVVLLLAAPGAQAAPRQVPQGFFGMVWDGPVSDAPDSVQQAQWDAMAASGVEAVRAVFRWSDAQSAPGAGFDFSTTDRLVSLAAVRGLPLLPVVQYAPHWARAYPSRPTSPPRRSSEYDAYLQALVRRYGPSGSFWAENPAVPRQPLREWQIWNEPHLRTYWDAPARSRYGHPGGYVRLLRAAHRAIKRADPGARVVLAGLTQLAWDQLAILYRRGVRRYFDVATLQAFPQTADRALRAARLFRRAMGRAGDGGKPIYVTELTWPASRGRTKGIPFQRQETPKGMARRLREAYAVLARSRRRLGLTRVYWYTWASPYGRGGSIFRYAGLQRSTSVGTLVAQPALDAYRRSARFFEGCSKDERARCRFTSSG
jgi:polysaccharide biosynthesis protein PslG